MGSGDKERGASGRHKDNSGQDTLCRAGTGSNMVVMLKGVHESRHVDACTQALHHHLAVLVLAPWPLLRSDRNA